MKLKLVAAIAVIAGLPFCAQAQQPPASAPKATNADAQRVVKMITSDKAKSQAYCDMTKIGDEMEQAQQKHDDKTADALAQKADDLAGKLGTRMGCADDRPKKRGREFQRRPGHRRDAAVARQDLREIAGRFIVPRHRLSRRRRRAARAEPAVRPAGARHFRRIRRHRPPSATLFDDAATTTDAHNTVSGILAMPPCAILSTKGSMSVPLRPPPIAT